jgi:hypothetical protein
MRHPFIVAAAAAAAAAAEAAAEQEADCLMFDLTGLE